MYWINNVKWSIIKCRIYIFKQTNYTCLLALQIISCEVDNLYIYCLVFLSIQLISIIIVYYSCTKTDMYLIARQYNKLDTENIHVSILLWFYSTNTSRYFRILKTNNYETHCYFLKFQIYCYFLSFNYKLQMNSRINQTQLISTQFLQNQRSYSQSMILHWVVEVMMMEFHFFLTFLRITPAFLLVLLEYRSFSIFYKSIQF